MLHQPHAFLDPDRVLSQALLFEDPGILAWLPDETMFSLASRQHAWSGHGAAWRTCLQLFGSKRGGMEHDFPSHLNVFVDRSQGVAGEALALVNERTLLPYYLPFRTEEQARDAIAGMCGSGIGAAKARLGLLASRFRANHPLKACLQCIVSDSLKHGTAYWHLAHQYPGVWVCSEHRCLLSESTLKATGVGRFWWHLPRSDSLVIPTSDGRPMNERDEGLRAFSRFATLIQHCVKRSAGFHFEPAALSRVYRRSLEQRGMTNARGGVRMAAAASTFVEHCRELRVVRELGALPATTAAAASQLTRLFGAPRGGTHPIRHLTVIDWLFEEWSEFELAYLSAAKKEPTQRVPAHEPVRLSGPAARETARLELVRLITIEGRSLRSAAVQLDVDSATAAAWATRAGIRVLRRPKLLKPVLLDGLIAGLRSGADKQELATRYGISVETVTRVLRTEINLHIDWCAARSTKRRTQARADWLRLSDEAGWQGVSAVRRLAPGDYAWLNRHDREWLRQQNAKLMVQPRGNGSAVDWDRRDSILANEVKKLALRIRLERPTERVERWQIYQLLPELKAKLQSLGRLPLTKAALTIATGAIKSSCSRERPLF